MQTIAGLDISKDTAQVSILSEIPADLRKAQRQTFKVKLSAEGLRKLLSKEFDAVVLEPTGMHYSSLWAQKLTEAGKEVRWIGHQEIIHFRKSWREFNKTDAADAVALACYGLERWNRGEHYFVPASQNDLRTAWLQLEHLQAGNVRALNRLRQQLAHEFPEVASTKLKRSWGQKHHPALLQALAGVSHWKPKLKTLKENSIGEGISNFSKTLAKTILFNYEAELEIEAKADKLLKAPEYQPYLEVFEKYWISGKIQVAMISVLFPIEKFLDENKRPKKEHYKNSKGKSCTRRVSEGAFKLSCGVGQVLYQSGATEKWITGGRSDLRTALYQWCCVFMMRCGKKTKTPIPTELKDLVEYRNQNKNLPGNQLKMRIVERMLRKLFRDLVKAIN